MKRSFIKLCIAGCLLLYTSCNNKANNKNTNGSDTIVAADDTTATPENMDNRQSTADIINKTEYSYGPSSVITGKISTEVFYGSPGFGENPETDEKEERYLLLLDKPINVIGEEKPEDDSKESKYDISKIQLQYEKDSIDMGRYLGSAVVLTGTFFGAHTGHHHTPVIMEVDKVVFK